MASNASNPDAMSADDFEAQLKEREIETYTNLLNHVRTEMAGLRPQLPKNKDEEDMAVITRDVNAMAVELKDMLERTTRGFERSVREAEALLELLKEDSRVMKSLHGVYEELSAEPIDELWGEQKDKALGFGTNIMNYMMLHCKNHYGRLVESMQKNQKEMCIIPVQTQNLVYKCLAKVHAKNAPKTREKLAKLAEDADHAESVLAELRAKPVIAKSRSARR